MNALVQVPGSAEAADVVADARSRGVLLWTENGQLHYRAPRGVLTPEALERLRRSSRDVVAYLQQMTATAQVQPADGRVRRAPIAFTQLSYIIGNDLAEHPGVRYLSGALRLRGRLDVELLRATLGDMVRRHEALRTRIVFENEPLQEVCDECACELTVEDFSCWPESTRTLEVIRRIHQLMIEPVDLRIGPLCTVHLARLCQDEHVLIVTMEHVISDASSVNILLRDLLSAYLQAARHENVVLPPIPVQLSEHAIRQRVSHRAWLAKHGTFWEERLADCGRLSFPADPSAPSSSLGWGTVPIEIGSELKEQLREWSRVRRTTMTMSVFTVFVALVLRWCNALSTVLRFQTDGRFSSDVQNTIGYLAAVLYLRVELRDEDTFLDLLRHVVAEYCSAYEHADPSYLEARVPPPTFLHNSAFNWVPQESHSVHSSGSCHPLEEAAALIYDRPVRSDRPVRIDSEPGLLLYDTDAGIRGTVCFPAHRFSAESMARFADCFMRLLRAMLQNPCQRVMSAAPEHSPTAISRTRATCGAARRAVTRD